MDWSRLARLLLVVGLADVGAAGARQPPALVLVDDGGYADFTGQPSEAHAALASGKYLYTAGSVASATAGKNASFTQFNRSLAEQGGYTFDGFPHGDDEFLGVAAGPKGSVFSVGYSTQSGRGKDIFAKRVVKHFTFPDKSLYENGGGDDEGHAIVVDRKGMVWLTGYETVPGQDTDVWIGRYDFDLNPLGATTVNGPGNGADDGRALAFDRAGHLFVAGSMTRDGTGVDIWVGKFDAMTLAPLKDAWVAGDGAGTDVAYGLIVDRKGFVYVVGSIATADQGLDLWIGKFDNDLNPVTSVTRSGPGTARDDVAYAVTSDPKGRLFVAGTVGTDTAGDDAWLGVFDPNLNFIVDTSTTPMASVDDRAYGILRLSDGSLLLSGMGPMDPGGVPSIRLTRWKAKRLPPVKR